MIKGVIFDLDGVLVSTDALHFKAWGRLAKELGIHDFTEADNKRQRGVSRMESLEVVLEKQNKAFTEEEKFQMTERKNAYYVEMLQELTGEAVLAEVIDALNMLKAKGILIGVGSVSKNTPAILERTGLAGYIDKVSCGLDITRSKPDPEVFNIAAEKLGLSSSECLVVEDSEAGVIAAKAADMVSLGVGPNYKDLGATYCSPTLMTGVNWEAILNA